MGGDVTRILDELRRGVPGAEDALLERVYSELRSLAAAQMGRERAGHTLQPTALVHEAYVRLLGTGAPAFEGRAHFFGAAARAMRRVLVDSARAHRAAKRGGAEGRAIPAEEDSTWAASPDETLAVHEALGRLEAIDPRMSRVVELRFFCGLTAEETAAAMGISVRSGYELWEHARAWLFREISP